VNAVNADTTSVSPASRIVDFFIAVLLFIFACVVPGRLAPLFQHRNAGF
jgi:hypothetical protein